MSCSYCITNIFQLLFSWSGIYITLGVIPRENIPALPICELPFDFVALFSPLTTVIKVQFTLLGGKFGLHNSQNLRKRRKFQGCLVQMPKQCSLSVGFFQKLTYLKGEPFQLTPLFKLNVLKWNIQQIRIQPLLVSPKSPITHLDKSDAWQWIPN